MTSFSLLLSFVFTMANNNGSSIDPLPVKPKEPTINKTLLLDLVNNVRKKGCRCGDTWYPSAPPLTWNNKLEEAALLHSNDMLQNNYFSHTANDGSKAAERIDAAGYNWRAYGENIALGYRTEREVVQGWISSPGHCTNIMNKSFKEMGVARAGNYWTQELATQ